MSTSSTPIRVDIKEVGHIHVLLPTLEYSTPASSPPVPGQTFISKLEQKMLNDTSSGVDRFELDAKRHKNQAQAAPMDSSNCSKSRMSIGREFMCSVRENE